MAMNLDNISQEAIENPADGSFQLVKKGSYKGVITKALEDTTQGGHQMIKVTTKIIEADNPDLEDQIGLHVFSNYNDSPEKGGYAQRRLVQFLTAVGIEPAGELDVEDLVGIEYGFSIVHNKDKNDETLVYANVTAEYNLETGESKSNGKVKANRKAAPKRGGGGAPRRVSASA